MLRDWDPTVSEFVAVVPLRESERVPTFGLPVILLRIERLTR
jgi:hypothetical protein